MQVRTLRRRSLIVQAVGTTLQDADFVVETLDESGGLSAAVFRVSKFGRADRDRTGDLLNAIRALSQLSYSPT
jgi:hypothetical protein